LTEHPAEIHSDNSSSLARSMRRGLPLYVQIESALRERIVAGEYPAGGAFPTDEKLRQEFGVSRATVRLALDTLHREGLIVRYPGRGSFVNEVRERARTLRFHGSVRDLITQGDVHGPTFTVTAVAVARATPSECAELKLAGDARVTRIAGLRKTENEPTAHVVVSLPEAVGALLALRSGRVYPPISSMVCDQLHRRVREIRQVIAVAMANPAVARALRIRVGASLLTIRRTYIGVDGAPVEFAVSSYAGDTYQYEAIITGDAQAELRPRGPGPLGSGDDTGSWGSLRPALRGR
jgi:GntR family transcriptional regulator